MGGARSAAALAAAWGLLAATAAAAEPALRVLVAESRGPLVVGGERVAPAGVGLRVAGRSLGGLWQSPSPGPTRVGALRLRGAVRVLRVAEGLQVVNEAPLEAYVAATVGREVYAHWHPETHKAQAVVARTYGLHQAERRRGEAWHLRADTAGQVYGGIDAESPWALAAARATRGERLLWGRRPILAVYHSSSGGRTASAEEVWGEAIPYLASRPVENEEDSPDTYWRASISGPTLRRALDPLGIRVGRIRELHVLDRSASGRARRILIAGSGGRREVSARALRTALGADVIRSTLFEIRRDADAVVFVGSGHGHGVGMSQWGAEAMARRGASYREILAAFYPGTQIARPGSEGP